MISTLENEQGKWEVSVFQEQKVSVALHVATIAHILSISVAFIIM
jgi:hypothetical protein